MILIYFTFIVNTLPLFPATVLEIIHLLKQDSDLLVIFMSQQWYIWIDLVKLMMGVFTALDKGNLYSIPGGGTVRDETVKPCVNDTSEGNLQIVKLRTRAKKQVKERRQGDTIRLRRKGWETRGEMPSQRGKKVIATPQGFPYHQNHLFLQKRVSLIKTVNSEGFKKQLCYFKIMQRPLYHSHI